MMSQQRAADYLHLHGYRSTPQRHFILQALEQEQRHLTIEQILKQVQEWWPQMTLSTIYRTLDLLIQLELARFTYIAGQHPIYERTTGIAHHHMMCRRCHTFLHLDATLLENLNTHLEQEYHFHQIGLELQVTGYCDTCWKEEQAHQTEPLPEIADAPHIHL